MDTIYSALIGSTSLRSSCPLALKSARLIPKAGIPNLPIKGFSIRRVVSAPAGLTLLQSNGHEPLKGQTACRLFSQSGAKINLLNYGFSSTKTPV